MDLAHSSRGESYKCKVCGKTFGKQNTLTMHMSVHDSKQTSFASLEQPRNTRSSTRQLRNNSHTADTSPSATAACSSDAEHGRSSSAGRRRSARTNVKSQSPQLRGTTTRAGSKSRMESSSAAVQETSVQTRGSASRERKQTVDSAKEKLSKDQVVVKSVEKVTEKDNATSVEVRSEMEESMDTLSSPTHSSLINNNNLKDDELVNTDNVKETIMEVSSAQQASRGVEIQMQSPPQDQPGELVNLDTSKEDSDKENLDNASKVQIVQQMPVSSTAGDNQTEKIVFTTPVVQNTTHGLESAPNPYPMVHPQQHVVIKVQKAPVMQNGVATSQMTTSQVVTIPLVMSSMGAPLNSHMGGQPVAQVYTFPAGAAPVQVTQAVLGAPSAQVTSAELQPSASFTTMTSAHIPGAVETYDPPIEPPSLSQHISPIDGDDTPVRKSARLTGKVPGWKTFLHDEHTTNESRPRKRKMAGRVASSEVETDNDVETTTETSQDDDIEEALKRQRVGGKEDFPCEVCGKSFTSEKYLSMHSALHGPQNPADEFLQEDFKDQQQEGYLKTGNTWMCKICSKVFAQNSSFKNHMRTHSDERPYVCQICSIGFKERYHLKKHQLFKHSTELKEKCRFCGKKFKDSTAVRAHERIHSEERPYSCRRCNKAFKTSECLWHHENRSKTCGQVAHTFPPTQRGRRGRPSRKQQEKEQEVKSSIQIVHAPPMHSPQLQHHVPIQSQSLPPQQNQVHAPAQMHVYTSAQPTSHHVPHTVVVSQPQPQQFVPQPVKDVMVKSEPLSEEEYFEELDLVNQVIESVQATTNMESILQDVEDGPLLNEDGELLIPSEPDPPTSIGDISVPVSNNFISVTSVPPTPVTAQQHVVTAMPQSTLPAHVSMAHPVVSTMPKQAPLATVVTQPQTVRVTQHPATSVVTLPQVQSIVQNAVPAHNLIKVGNAAQITVPNSLPTPRPTPTAAPHISMEKEAAARPVATVQPVQRVAPMVKQEVKEESQLIKDLKNQSLKGKMSNFTCPKCFKGFAVPSAFQKHLQRHEEVRPFHCEICDLGFKLKVHLKKHNLYRHSSEYPCECKICGKKFKDSSAVRLHERIHSEDRPFHCGCGKTFKTKENLWGHQHRKMCPLASESPTPEDRNMQAEASVQNGHVTAKIKDNQIFAQAIVSNNKVTAQATIGNNGELTAHASVISNSMLAAQASLQGGRALVKVENHSTMHDGRTMSPAITITSQPPAIDQQIHPATTSVFNFTTTANSVQTPVTAISNEKSLPSFEILTSTMRSPGSPAYSQSPQPKKESLADKCPTIQNLLKKGPTATTKLPGIQQLFQSHMKPPPPYPGKQANKQPMSTYPTSPGRYQSRSNAVSPAPSQLMINPDKVYESSRGPFLRTPPPPPYNNKSRDSASPAYSDYSPGSVGAQTPSTPGSSVSGDSSLPVIYWDDEIDRKPVVTQWQQQDSDTLFHELSNTVLNQL